MQEYIFSEQKEVQLSLTNAKINDEKKEAGEKGDDEDVDNIKEIKEENGKTASSSKETGYNVNYKEPLTEQMVLPTPPLPPWKGRRTVQRSFSSEMLTGSDSYYNPTDYVGGELETQLPTESSGYHSGSLSKTHKNNSGRWYQYFCANDRKVQSCKYVIETVSTPNVAVLGKREKNPMRNWCAEL